jgi:hypothetical protein
MGVMLQAFYWDCPTAEHERSVVGLMNAIYRALAVMPESGGTADRSAMVATFIRQIEEE